MKMHGGLPGGAADGSASVSFGQRCFPFCRAPCSDFVPFTPRFSSTWLKCLRSISPRSCVQDGFISDCHVSLTFTHVLDDPLVVALPKDHPLARKNSLSAQDLESQSMIFYPKDSRGVFGQQLKNLLATANVRFTAAYEAIEIHTALALVGAGMGLTLVGRSVTQNNRNDIVFRAIDDLHQDTTLMAVTRQGEINSLAEDFIDILLSEGVKLPVDEAVRPELAA